MTLGEFIEQLEKYPKVTKIKFYHQDDNNVFTECEFGDIVYYENIGLIDIDFLK